MTPAELTAIVQIPGAELIMIAGLGNLTARPMA